MKRSDGGSAIGNAIDATKLPMELTLADHMGQFLYRQLSSMLRQAKECNVDKLGFFVVEFSTTHLSQTAPTFDSFWFDNDAKDAEGMPEPIRRAHLYQLDKLAGDNQARYCAFLFRWRKEQLQQSIVFSLPDLLELKDVDRTQHDTVAKQIATHTVKEFVQKRFLPHHKNLFAGDNVHTSAYRWTAAGHTVGNLLHMVAMHGRTPMVKSWESLQTLRKTLQELCKGREVRIHLVLDRKTVLSGSQTLEAAQGTAVGVVVYAYEHVASSTHVQLLFAHVEAEHAEAVTKQLYAQLIDFGTSYNVDRLTVYEPNEASAAYVEWLKSNESALKSAFGIK
jgi:hypothetical protein